MSNTKPMTTDVSASRAVWTSKDEAALRELAERKERVMAECKQRLLDVLTPAVGMTNFVGLSTEIDALADNMIGAAEAFRDALLPFDSRGQ